MSVVEQSLVALAEQVVSRGNRSGIMVAVAESCTGGLVAAALTSVSGSSAVLDRGFVTYSNQAKTEMLGVPAPLIEECGAVSRQVAASMAEGALRHSQAGVTVSITGIAGPGGGSAEKPVGTVCFGRVVQGQAPETWIKHFPGDRDQVRCGAAHYALCLLKDALP